MTPRAVVKALHSPDVYDLQGWVPPESDCFAFLLQVMVGSADGPGEESFDFVVATPEWLRRKYGEDAVIVGRPHLLVFRYDFKRLVSTVKSLVASIEGADWSEFGEKLGRFGHWEFEDYKP